MMRNARILAVSLKFSIVVTLLLIMTTPVSASTMEFSTVDGVEVEASRPWLRLFGKAFVFLRVINTTDDAVTGKMRVVADWDGWKLQRPDGYDEAGNPFVWLSTETGDVLPAGERSKIIAVKFKRTSRPGHWFHRHYPWRPAFMAEGQVQPLHILHNADMDGATGALDNVINFSALVDGFKKDPTYAEATVLLSSGDNYIPGPRYSAAADPTLNPILGLAGEGRGDIAMLNAMGYQASAVGNHDLDPGPAGFAGIIAESSDEEGNYYPGAQFPYLSTNLDFTTEPNTEALVTSDGQLADNIPNALARTATLSVQGQTIGLVGATTPKLADITTTGSIEILPADSDDVAALAAEIQMAVDTLTAEGINKIIVLAHMQQIEVEKALAGLLTDVDVIIAGGSNTLLADATDVLREGDAPADTYPLVFQSPQDEPVLVVNTGGDYTYLGRLLLSFDANGIIDLSRLDPEINGAYAASDEVVEDLGFNPITRVVDIATALSDILAERDGNILGQTDVYLDGRRGQVRTQETNMGNLTADANLWVAQKADSDTVISIKNGGGIRDDIGYFAYPPGSTSPEDLEFFPPAANLAAGKAAGDISQFDIQGTLRFNNGLTLLTVTAEELLAIIEHGVSATEPGSTPGQFPQVAGLRFSFDPSLPANNRVVNMVVDTSSDTTDVVVQDGELVGEAARTFRLVTLNFLAGGGDGYPFPSTDRVDLVDSGLPEELGAVVGVDGRMADFAEPGSEQDALAEFLQEFHDPVLSGSSTPFAMGEMPIDADERIQNLAERLTDTVIP